MELDLNCDLGEGFGVYSIGEDDRLLDFVTSVNIACGFHAGDPNIMQQTVQKALAAGVAIGAHPGLGDREGFGLRQMPLSVNEVHNLVVYQVGALAAFVQAAGGKLHHVRLHGALSQMADADPSISRAVVQALLGVDRALFMYAPSGGMLSRVAKRLGLKVINEAYADRGYQADGTLIPRSEPEGTVTSTAVAVSQAISLTQGKVRAAGGAMLELAVDSLHIQGKGERAVTFAHAITQGLHAAGVELRTPANSLMLESDINMESASELTVQEEHS